MTATLLKVGREYIDLDFTFTKHPISNSVSVKKGVNAVKQSVLNLMRLKSNDKPFHPEIKSPIYEFMFDNASPIMEVVLEDEVKRYLEFYEPRVNITNVNVRFPGVNTLQCFIEGEVINISEPFTVNVLIERIR